MGSDWDTLSSFFPGYSKRLAESGYRNTRLVPPSGSEKGKIVTTGTFAEQCGAVVAIVQVTCVGGQLLSAAWVERAAAGNRGWNGGSRGCAPKGEKDAADFAKEYLMQARQILS
jgi:hypothetical protein